MESKEIFLVTLSKKKPSLNRGGFFVLVLRSERFWCRKFFVVGSCWLSCTRIIESECLLTMQNHRNLGFSLHNIYYTHFRMFKEGVKKKKMKRVFTTRNHSPTVLILNLKLISAHLLFSDSNCL